MRTKFLAVAAAATMAMSAMPGHAETTDATYIATPAFRASDPSVPVGLGGFRFVLDAKPTKVRITDLNGTGQGITVCQENTSDEAAGDLGNICGDGADDITTSYCNDGLNRDISALPWTKAPFTVFTPMVSTDCPQVATTGTIRITF